MEPTVYLEMGMVGLAGIGILTAGALRGWKGWLELKRLELQSTSHSDALPAPNMTSRIEIADLKERIRKLEAIAAGVDL
ncbi:hypothetical protein HJG53_04070 [Sphingomonas sp. ID1715]|uniref:hypothetical protein n=1 Tax=Sphingomonas sp. ID1715 TaxID=1656898 RepID=UPI001489ECF4|nr:hypothetical protein [Sphingomonas sp. ID1715]NNM76084.1 hypothetical protein [Sphingomonas sp. ID1715]